MWPGHLLINKQGTERFNLTGPSIQLCWADQVWGGQKVGHGYTPDRLSSPPSLIDSAATLSLEPVPASQAGLATTAMSPALLATTAMAASCLAPVRTALTATASLGAALVRQASW